MPPLAHVEMLTLRPELLLQISQCAKSKHEEHHNDPPISHATYNVLIIAGLTLRDLDQSSDEYGAYSKTSNRERSKLFARTPFLSSNLTWMLWIVAVALVFARPTKSKRDSIPRLGEDSDDDFPSDLNMDDGDEDVMWMKNQDEEDGNEVDDNGNEDEDRLSLVSGSNNEDLIPLDDDA